MSKSTDQQSREQNSVERQAERYDAEAAAHAEHHQDEWTQKYRDMSFRKPFANLDFKGKLVLDAMCASGIDTGYFLQKGATVEGLDISEQNCKIFSENWKLPCHQSSIHETGLPDNHFDFVYIGGGLHHIIPFMPETFAEIHRVLKPGGHFLFVEPNADTWINHLRALWYRRSERFQDEERALHYTKEIKAFQSLGFSEVNVHYGGNIAYLMVGQSLSLGISPGAKSVLAGPIMGLEKFINIFPFAPKLFFASTWQKNEHSA